MRLILERLADELVALTIVVTASAVSAYLAVQGDTETLKAFFTNYVAPLTVPIIAYYFGSKTAAKTQQRAQQQ